VPRRSVSVSRKMAATVEAVWAVAGDFCGDWHPFIEWVRAEESEGTVIRRFKVKGEEGLYRERLTYHSESDRVLRYEHVEGIRDVASYQAMLRVLPDATVEWSAAIEAAEPRASEIAAGTREVFEAGLAALAGLSAVRDVIIDGAPQLAVSHTAAKEGPLLLFLHGIGGNRKNWQRQISVVSARLQCAAMDFRGYGESALGPSQSRVDDHCSDVLRVMTHFGKERVILCGLSFGAWIALSFAMRHPEKLSGLILSGGATGMSEASDEEREAFLSARQKPLDEGKTSADFSGEVVNAIAGPLAGEELRAEMRATMAAIPAAGYRDALWCFTHPEERFDFSRISCPVLLMTGEHDRLAAPAEIRGVAERIHAVAARPDMRFEMVEGAGHLCNLENPQRYNALLRQFVRRNLT
jgi:pimeloyl-ACP methyl ester carboxylesterase